MANDNTWLDPSPVGTEYSEALEVMSLCADVPVNKAFKIEKDFDVGLLRKIARDYKNKKIVVIDHRSIGAGIEVRRLDNNADVEFFYKKSNLIESDDSSSEQKDIIKKHLENFLTESEANIAKYDPLCVSSRKQMLVSYSYLQRKCVAVAAFRKDERGATAAIKSTLSILDSEGVIKILNEAESMELTNTAAQFYRINKFEFLGE